MNWTEDDSARAFHESFDKHIHDQVERTGVDTANWRAGGRASKQWPEKETEAWWRANGPQQVQNYVHWRDSTNLPLWITPAGEPAIELGLNCVLGNTVVKMFIDRVFQNPSDNSLVVVDVKTGSRTPDSDLQLGFYAAGIRKVFGIDVKWGAYWMSRQGSLTPYVDLSRFNEHLIGRMLGDFEKAVDEDIFIPNLTGLCNSCGVRRACAAFGGPEAQEFDPLHPAYEFKLPTIKESA